MSITIVRQRASAAQRQSAWWNYLVLITCCAGIIPAQAIAATQIEATAQLRVSFADVQGRWPTESGSYVRQGTPAYSIDPVLNLRIETARLASLVSLRSTFLTDGRDGMSGNIQESYDCLVLAAWKATRRDTITIASQYAQDSTPGTESPPDNGTGVLPDDSFTAQAHSVNLRFEWERILTPTWKCGVQLLSLRQWLAQGGRLPGTGESSQSDAVDFDAELIKVISPRAQVGGVLLGSRYDQPDEEVTGVAGLGLTGVFRAGRLATVDLMAGYVSTFGGGEESGEDLTFKARLLTDVQEGQLVLEVRRRYWDPLGMGRPQLDQQLLFSAPWINIRDFSIVSTWSAHWIRSQTSQAADKSRIHMTGFNITLTKRLVKPLHIHATVTARSIRIGSAAERRTGKEHIALVGLSLIPVRGFRSAF